jgi:selenocysteine-specific elongation factor
MPTRRTLILGTAGHVDHGKTSLVKALTGVDTDRLDEEHRRGISIELGFAHLDLRDDLRLGLVDVPGHERFVRQMVAGAGGMDLAMLLVAADEGWMPQTVEHFDVLRLLGVGGGVIAITKMDLADLEMVELIEEETRERVTGSFLEGAPILRVSAQGGQGLDELRASLARVADRCAPKMNVGDFRLPVDRVFSMPGSGAVVTGTAWSGSVRPNDQLRLLPSEKSVRVREVQSHGALAESASAGERVALALRGVKKDEIVRGEQLVSGPAWSASRIVALRVTALASLGSGRLKQRARFHVHHAAREVLGRVDLLETDTLAAGESSLARLHLEAPLVARPGDRLVLRSYSPMLTVAGGVVLDPRSPARQRRADSLRWLSALEEAGVDEWPRFAAQGEGVAAVPRTLHLARLSMLGFDAEAAQRKIEDDLEAGVLLALGDRILSPVSLDAAAGILLAHLRAHQATQPFSPGLGKEELRSLVGLAGGAQFQAFLELMSHRHPLFLRGDRVRADGASVELDASMAEGVARWEERIRGSEPAYSPSRADMKDAQLRLLIDRGDVVILDGPLLAHRVILEALGERVLKHFSENEELKIGELKEWTQASRKYVVPIMEWLDREGYSNFDGKVRRAGRRVRPS